METKHTPGPWKISFKENNQNEIENESGQMGIARVWDYDTDEATEANTKLIAAAPELLEALSDCEEYLRLNLLDALHPLAIKAADAIKKATP